MQRFGDRLLALTVHSRITLSCIYRIPLN